MQKYPFRIVALSAVLMSAAMVFGLYPETPAEKMAAVSSIRSPQQLAIDAYQGRTGPGFEVGNRISLAVKDQLCGLANAAFRRLAGAS